MAKLLLRILAENRGATAVEYGLIIALLVIAMTAALNNFADGVSNMYNHVGNSVSSAT